MTGVLLNIGKYFLIDLAVVVVLFLIVFFIEFIVNLIRNGKSHKLTNGSVIKYSFKHFTKRIGKNFSQLVKWILIFFVVHMILVFFDSILGWAKDTVTYESVPIVALAVDILQPIVKAILPVIFPILAILVCIILIYSLVKTVEASSKSEKKLTANEKIAAFGEGFQKGILWIGKSLPKLFIILVICVSLNSVFLSINNITKIIDDYKAVQEMKLAVKNLANSEAFARVSLINESSRDVKSMAGKGWSGTTVKNVPVKTYKIEILGSDGNTVSEQTLVLDGNQIVIDSININFDYSEIAGGEKFNIAYPYRVYSEIIPAVRAKELTCMFNDKNIPVIYCLNQKDIYGLENDVYYNRLAELFDIIKDDNKSKEMGIRSTIGNAIHLTMHKGDVIDISIEGTGGLSVSKHESLFND